MSIYNPSYNDSIKNNGGVALNSGVPYSDNAQSIKTFYNKRRTYEFPFASTIVDGVNVTNATQSVLTPVPYNSKRPLIKRATKTIAAQSSDVLLSPGNLAPNLTSSIHPIISYRTRLQHTAFVNGKLNVLTGKYDFGYPDNQQDDFGSDEAAYPSRKNPGTMFFKNGRNISVVPYQSKTN
jgi:hypothetical protein